MTAYNRPSIALLLLRRHPWKVIFGLVSVILVYAALFQFFYVWMRYGVINAYGTVSVLVNTYLMNLVPLSLLWIIISAIVFLPSYRCGWRLRTFITLSLSMAVVGIINTCFILITNEYVEWGGTFFNSFMIYLICYVAYYEMMKRVAEEERTEALHQLMEYKQRMMLAQFKPHFLFNSLNILYSMEGNADVEDTRRFILSLSHIYRYILDNQNKKEILLESELLFLDNYLFILNLRYDSKFKVIFKGEPLPDRHILPLSLQLLIENVVKHNRLTSSTPMEVEITFTRSGIRVTNPIRENLRKPVMHEGPHSLDTLKDIYQSYNKEVIIKNDGLFFSVEIPYLF